VIALILAHFVEVELQSECSFELDREVPKDEEGSIEVVRVLEAVERRNQSTSQCSAERSLRYSFVFAYETT
jgi:hypothetical protein